MGPAVFVCCCQSCRSEGKLQTPADLLLLAQDIPCLLAGFRYGCLLLVQERPEEGGVSLEWPSCLEGVLAATFGVSYANSPKLGNAPPSTLSLSRFIACALRDRRHLLRPAGLLGHCLGWWLHHRTGSRTSPNCLHGGTFGRRTKKNIYCYTCHRSAFDGQFKHLADL